MVRKTFVVLAIVLVIFSVSCMHTEVEEKEEVVGEPSATVEREGKDTLPVTPEGEMFPPEWMEMKMRNGNRMGQTGEDGSFFSTIDETIYAASVSSPENPLTYFDEEDVLHEEEYQKVKINLEEGKLSSSTLLEGLTVEVDNDGNVVIKNKSEAKLNYVLSGQWNGTLMLTNDNSSYMVTLDSVTITGNTLPGMQLKSSTKAFLLLKGDSYIQDAKTNGKKGALTSSGDVILQGDGCLTITAFKKHGLKVDGTVRLVSGTLNIVTDEEAEGNAISVDDAYIQDGGKLQIEAKGSVYGSESKGLKVNGREKEVDAKGYLVINGGYVDIVSVGKAMTAGWKIEEDAETESTLDDPTPNLIINGGVIRIKTTGTPYEVSEEESLSPEGMEAKNLLSINGGMMEIITTDDGINSGKAFELNGGLVFVYSRAADGVDSNGTVVVNDGVMVALGAGGAEGGIDCDFDSAFTYRGGLVLGMGGMNNGPGAQDTDHAAISLAVPVSAGSSFAVVDEEGNALVAFTIPTYYQSGMKMELLSEELILQQNYQILSDVSITADVNFNGLALGNVMVTGGQEVSSLTVTSFVNGETGMFGGRGGMDGPMPDGFRGDFRERDFGEGMHQKGMNPDFRMEPPEGLPPMEARPMWN